MGDILKHDAATAAKAVAGVSDVQVELVWDPPWGLERISDCRPAATGDDVRSPVHGTVARTSSAQPGRVSSSTGSAATRCKP